MKRFLFPLLVAVAVCASWVTGPLQAQQAPFTQAFSLTYAGQSSPVIQFNTAISSCGVVVVNGGSFTLVPQSSNDGQTWVTATGINSGSISALGSFTGGIANTGLMSFRVSLSTVDSTAVTGTITCSGALARASAGATGAPGPSGPPGPTGSPGPASSSTPAAGNCIGVSTPPAAGTITNLCTPVPLTVSTPLVLTTPGGDSINIACPGCGGGGGAPWYPFAIVQECVGNNYGLTTSVTATCTLPNTATSGDTLVAEIATNGSVDTITTPTGYTKILGQIATSTQVASYIKTSAGTETGISITIVSSATTWGVRLYEISGTHAVDQEATAAFAASSSNNLISFPALSPSSGSMVFSLACIATADSNFGTSSSVTANWLNTSVDSSNASNTLMGAIYRGSGSGTAIVTPQISYGHGLFDSGVATGIFSIL